jgi:hypothetical protein
MRHVVAKMRELFIARMTVDSPHGDARRKDFNQAIFFESRGEYRQCFNGTTMEMVLTCFDDAVRDFRDSFCDSEKCKRPR